LLSMTIAPLAPMLSRILAFSEMLKVTRLKSSHLYK
jgi:hypothetical protein